MRWKETYQMYNQVIKSNWFKAGVISRREKMFSCFVCPCLTREFRAVIGR